jgi:murein DD-endopeptidase MepM/ murein hydrolase activator NlpD
MSHFARRLLRPMLLGATVVALAACDNGLDWDLRARTDGPSTAEAARQATAERPQPDARGVISYPGYQVVVARRGERVSAVARRLGLDADELARFNALPPETELRQGEVLALPRRVDPGLAGAPAADRPGGIDVAAIANTALDRASDAGAAERPGAAAQGAGPEPIRHQVVRGETAFSIARLYNVSTRSLADWNGLGPEMTVREGQFLLIPVPAEGQRIAAATPPAEPTRPGAGSPTPEPPSAAQPLPQDDPAVAAPAAPPESPDLAAERSPSVAGGGILAYPVQGQIIREYRRGSNDGISIAAQAGSPVRAAADGTVAAITQDTDQMPIIVIRHADNLLTVYANIDGIQVERGAQVRRGDTIASVRAGDPAFIHFEVRQGFDSVDPMDYLG